MWSITYKHKKVASPGAATAQGGGAPTIQQELEVCSTVYFRKFRLTDLFAS
jgi:hypothetical protein